MTRSSALAFAFPFALTLSSLTACGGGGSSGTASPPNPGGPTISQRVAAATATASSMTNDCATIRPFYWEIGDRNASLASASVDSATSSRVYRANTVMGIASASKWLYGAYYVQRSAGVLSADDVRFLTLQSGYTSFSACPQDATVQSCVQFSTNGEYTPTNDGLFFYDGGHMQKHASLRGLGPLDNAGLAAEMRSQLGTDVELQYGQPQLAGGAETSAEQYAKVLRKILTGQLRIGSMLGTSAVCTNPQTCPNEARRTVSPPGETWHYSLGHWIEDDPVVGDGTYSSPGLFGFYPWIDRSQTWYGIVARQDLLGAFDSIACGRAIRKAWVTATPL